MAFLCQVECPAAQFAGPSVACTDQPETACLGTGGGYEVNCVNELGTKPVRPCLSCIKQGAGSRFREALGAPKITASDTMYQWQSQKSFLMGALNAVDDFN